MAAPTNLISGDVIDAIRPDLEAFASLWSALRTNYQGTNITKTVARLLHMYQPEDGVLAYERLLRTLYVLLEDFDGGGLRLLVSMVPPPKGVPDEAIKEVFYKATGFVRLNAPIFHRNNAANLEFESNLSSNGKVYGGSSDSRTLPANPGTSRLLSFRKDVGTAPNGSTILQAVVKSEAPQKSNKSPKISTRESEIFRGFPPNEITTTQSHAKNMTHLCRPSINYGGYPAAQRYVDYHQMQGRSGSSNPLRGIDQSAYSRLNWFEKPLLVRKNNYGGTSYPDLILKTSENKYIRLPITKVNVPSIGNYTSSYNTPVSSAYQSYYQHNQSHMRNNSISDNCSSRDFLTNLSNHSQTNKTFENGDTLDERTIQIVEASRMNIVDHDCETTKSDDNTHDKENFASGNTGSPTNATIEKFRDAVISRQRAIQEDIYRMDVVHYDQGVITTPIEEFKPVDVESLTITEKLKKGVKSFLKRAEDGKSLELPAFPPTRALEKKPVNFPSALLKSSPRVWKLEKLSEYPGCWNQSPDSWQTKESTSSCTPDKRMSSTKCVTLKDSNANSRGSRGKMGQFPPATKSDRISQNGSNPLEISSIGGLQKNSSFEVGPDVDFPGREALPATESESKTIDAFHQAKSMSELVNYRKQYYDALLSIQRAKVAVANSLAISSSQSSANFDPRVFQYLQHQHQILHQHQQQLLMASQHPANRPAIVPPGYTNIRSAAGMWIRPSDWKYPPGGQYTFPRQAESVTTSPCTSQEPMDMPNDSSLAEILRRSSHNLHRASQRPPVKRRKLEEIVGKLKKSDD